MKKIKFPKWQKPTTDQAKAQNYLLLKRVFYCIAVITMVWGCIHATIECIQLMQNFATSAPGWVAFVLYLPLYGFIALIFLCIGLIFRRLAKEKARAVPKKEKNLAINGGNIMTYGEKIYTLREKNGLSQEELAEKLEVSRQTISNWENDKVKIDIVKAKQLCDILHISIEDFCSDEKVFQDNQEKSVNAENIEETTKPNTLCDKRKETVHNKKKTVSNNAVVWILLGASLLFSVVAIIDTIKTGTVTIGSMIEFKSSWWMVALVGFTCCVIVFLSNKKNK